MQALNWCVNHLKLHTLLVGAIVFLLLWILSIPYRADYMPNREDIFHLADSLLLVPDAHWQNWFTHGYSDCCAPYPEWPEDVFGLTRPAFQFVIYLAHFALGKNWGSYQIINCLAVAGLAAVTFKIAKTTLGLRVGPSVLAVGLVVLSPPVLESWLLGLAYAIEPIATLFVGCAFLAVIARRDFLCLMCLFAALLAKENAVWATGAAAITIMLRPKASEPLARQVFAATSMFLPAVMWLGLRYAFFGGVGGTYATTGYAPLASFLSLTVSKLVHIDALFASPEWSISSDWSAGGWALRDWARIGARLLFDALLCLWAIHSLIRMSNCLRKSIRDRMWPIMDETLLVAFWGASALAFHFALPIAWPRYATSASMFIWPAIVKDIQKRRNAIAWASLAACSGIMMVRMGHFAVSWSNGEWWRPGNNSTVAALREVPTTVRQIYFIPAEHSPLDTNPKHARAILGISAEIVRIADIEWRCDKASDLVAFHDSVADGVVSLTVDLPNCANFDFFGADFDKGAFANGQLYRNPSMSYELPDAYYRGPDDLYLGRKMIVHVHPNGPARFIIEHANPDGIAWFDISDELFRNLPQTSRMTSP